MILFIGSAFMVVASLSGFLDCIDCGWVATAIIYAVAAGFWLSAGGWAWKAWREVVAWRELVDEAKADFLARSLLEAASAHNPADRQGNGE